MTEQVNLNEIKAALAAATPGPWTYLKPWNEVVDLSRNNAIICKSHPTELNGNIEWGEFIANVPEWLSFLVYQLEEAQKTLEWYANDMNWIEVKMFANTKSDWVADCDDPWIRARETLKRLKGDTP